MSLFKLVMKILIRSNRDANHVAFLLRLNVIASQV